MDKAKQNLMDYLENYEKNYSNEYNGVFNMLECDVSSIAHDFQHPLSARQNVYIYTFEEYLEFLQDLEKDIIEGGFDSDNIEEKIEDLIEFHQHDLIIQRGDDPYYVLSDHFN